MKKDGVSKNRNSKFRHEKPSCILICDLGAFCVKNVKSQHHDKRRESLWTHLITIRIHFSIENDGADQRVFHLKPADSPLPWRIHRRTCTGWRHTTGRLDAVVRVDSSGVRGFLDLKRNAFFHLDLNVFLEKTWNFMTHFFQANWKKSVTISQTQWVSENVNSMLRCRLTARGLKKLKSTSKKKTTNDVLIQNLRLSTKISESPRTPAMRRF